MGQLAWLFVKGKDRLHKQGKKTLNFSKGVRKKLIFFLNMPEFQAFTSRLSAFI